MPSLIYFDHTAVDLNRQETYEIVLNLVFFIVQILPNTCKHFAQAFEIFVMGFFQKSMYAVKHDALCQHFQLEQLTDEATKK